ncbi:hypothetical protein FOA52_014316 [Chlamydomonas sp. UWO 241]|nr:hypothetical protein FOA52_014316 [Chlamydomonas sp. UWO 241]
MSVKDKPKVTACKASENWTCVTFKPDLAKFGMEVLEEETVALMHKRAYDLAGVLGKGVKVYLNGTRLPVKTFQEYVEQYLGPKEGGAPRIYERFSDRWEICVSTTEGQFNQVSFVNSICTYKGGTHVNYILDQICKALVEKINKKNKTANVKPFMVKNHVWLFINCSIENPAFDSQTKENLTLRATAFGSKCDVTGPFLEKIAKCGIIEHILSFANFKNQKELKKSDGAKRARLTGIPKLDDANEAGTRNSHQCTLILTEGDSAKSLAISGLSIVGRDHYGVFPLRGKLLNVREASAAQVSANAEIQNLKQILGLQHGKVYEDAKSLRYGHLMIMTDQDHDGSHIKGLIMNFLSTFYPSLLKLPGFLVEFITPIVKVTKGNQSKSFYTMPEYEEWKESIGGSTKGWKLKYYKGLGTSTAAEAKDYFAALDYHRKEFVWNGPEDDEAIELAFSKKKVDDRKTWLSAYTPGTFLDMAGDTVTYSDFVNKELILFSRADLERSIPSVMDGLKPGQRKILFASFKKKLYKEEVKVGNLGGYVSDNAAYHHGEASLTQTIVGMAQDFVGSNNINLMYPSGMFGTRRQGGKDAASARYIYTKLSGLTRHLFNEQDDQLLDYLNEDGQKIEPNWYLPIVPTVLINGAEGIGTGWSTSVPNYNPRDIVANIRHLLADEPMEPMHPWYRGFNGTIEEVAPARSRANAEQPSKSYCVSGIINQTSDTTLEIREMPVGKWTQDYKEWLESLIKPEDKTVEPLILDYREAHTDARVHFTLELTPAKMAECLAEGLITKFKLSSKFSTSNMTLFDQDGRIRHYSNPEEIIRDFFDVRLDYYERRRQAQIRVAEADMLRLSNMVRFILAVIDGSLKVANRKKADVIASLSTMGFDRINASKAKAAAEGKEDEGEEGEEADGGAGDARGYNYLLSMPIWSLTHERVEKLSTEAETQAAIVEDLRSMSNRVMWARDLDAFVAEYDAWEAGLDAAEASQTRAQKRAQKDQAKGKKGGKAAAKGGKKKGKAGSDDSESEADSEDDFEDDDFEEFVKPKPKAAPRKAPGAVAAAPKPAAAAAAAPPAKPAAPKAAAVPKPAAAAAAAPVTAAVACATLAATMAAKPAAADAGDQRLSLAERLAGRFQKLQVEGAPAAPSSSLARPAAATAAAAKPVAASRLARAATAGGASTSSGAAPAVAAKAAAKRKPAQKKKVVSSDDDDESDQSSEPEDDNDDDVFELDAPSPAVAPRGKKSKVGPSPLHMKVMAKMAAARVTEDDDDAPAAPKPAKAAPKPKPAKAAAAAPKPAAAPPAAAAKLKKAKDVCEVSDDDDDGKDSDGGSDDVGAGAAADVTPRAARAPRRATAAAPVTYVEIADSDEEEEASDSGSEFNGEESD